MGDDPGNQQTVTIDLPIPPSVNSYYHFTPRGVFIGKRGKDYRKYVMLKCVRLPKLTGKFAVVIELFPSSKRVIDLDNLNKCLLDSLQAARIIDNDGNIDDLHSVRRELAKPGKVRVTVKTI